GVVARWLENAVNATVGLRQDVRQEALRVASEVVQDERASPKARIEAARVLVLLGVQDRVVALKAGEVLGLQGNRVRVGPGARKPLLMAFSGLAALLSTAEASNTAAALARLVIERASDSDGEYYDDQHSVWPPVLVRLTPADAIALAHFLFDPKARTRVG